MISQTDLVRNISEATGISQGDVKAVLAALSEEIIESIKVAERIRVGNLIQVEPALRKATKKRMGRNPQTGEQIEISAKPASVRVKARILKPLQEAAPSVQKMKKQLA
jgi:nucleoid DNA-binding protein